MGREGLLSLSFIVRLSVVLALARDRLGSMKSSKLFASGLGYEVLLWVYDGQRHGVLVLRCVDDGG